MKARIEGGWLVVGPYAGRDLEVCDIAVGTRGPGEWWPAYKGWRATERVLQVRPPAGGTRLVKVWVRVSGVVTAAGTVTIS